MRCSQDNVELAGCDRSWLRDPRREPRILSRRLASVSVQRPVRGAPGETFRPSGGGPRPTCGVQRGGTAPSQTGPPTSRRPVGVRLGGWQARPSRGAPGASRRREPTRVACSCVNPCQRSIPIASASLNAPRAISSTSPVQSGDCGRGLGQAFGDRPDGHAGPPLGPTKA